VKRSADSEARGFRLRAGFAFALLVLGAGGLLTRAVYLQVFHNDYLKQQGDARSVRVMRTQAMRGSIFDRDGQPLAVSTPEASAYADPRVLATVPDRWNALARALHTNPAQFKQTISRSQNRSFIWLARHLKPDEEAAVRDLEVPGVGFRQELGRYYPQAEVTGQLLGYTDIDDMGSEGIELAWDSQLAGQPGSKRVIQDRMGRVVEDVESIAAARPGRDVTLALHSGIQFLAYRELKGAIEANRAPSGSIVVIDVLTGEILAMVNQPSFNPNNGAQRIASLVRNRAATDYLEPGSSIKPFMLAVALESGRFTPASMIDTSPIMLGNEPLVDEHPLGTIGLATVLAKSSNVGMAKIALDLQPQQIWTTLTQLGFGRVTASHFPGESAGVLANYSQWSKIGIASMSRGYGIAVTPLQLAQAYATIGALGVLRPASLERVAGPVQGERVISERTARELIKLLEGVVTEGTGSKAVIPGYRVAGKTGTAKKTGANGQYEDHYVAVFGGVAPASNPRLAAVVIIDDPMAGRYYGGDVAAPVFSAVVGGGLRLMGVAPDAGTGTTQDPLIQAPKMVSR
jgi:cell division protein FtsI (penicillin-binding protein 3)